MAALLLANYVGLTFKSFKAKVYNIDAKDMLGKGAPGNERIAAGSVRDKSAASPDTAFGQSRDVAGYSSSPSTHFVHSLLRSFGASERQAGRRHPLRPRSEASSSASSPSVHFVHSLLRSFGASERQAGRRHPLRPQSEASSSASSSPVSLPARFSSSIDSFCSQLRMLQSLIGLGAWRKYELKVKPCQVRPGCRVLMYGNIEELIESRLLIYPYFSMQKFVLSQGGQPVGLGVPLRVYTMQEVSSPLSNEESVGNPDFLLDAPLSLAQWWEVIDNERQPGRLFSGLDLDNLASAFGQGLTTHPHRGTYALATAIHARFGRIDKALEILGQGLVHDAQSEMLAALYCEVHGIARIMRDGLNPRTDADKFLHRVVVPDGKGDCFADTLGFDGRWQVYDFSKSHAYIDTPAVLQVLKALQWNIQGYKYVDVIMPDLTPDRVELAYLDFGQVYIAEESMLPGAIINERDIFFFVQPGENASRSKVVVCMTPAFLSIERKEQMRRINNVFTGGTSCFVALEEKYEMKIPDDAEVPRETPRVLCVSLSEATAHGIDVLEDSLLRAGIKAAAREIRCVDLLDTYMDEFAHLEELNGISPNVFCISVVNMRTEWAALTIKAIRHFFPEALVIVGGPASQYPEQLAALLVDFDFLVRGDGNEILPELLRLVGGYSSQRILPQAIREKIMQLAGGIIYRSPFMLVNRLSHTNRAAVVHLPKPKRRNKYHYLYLRYGCPHNCSFCNDPMGHAMRVASTRETVEWFLHRLCLEPEGGQDIFALEERLELAARTKQPLEFAQLGGKIRIDFYDDDFAADAAYVEAFCDEAIRLGLANYFEFAIVGTNVIDFFDHGNLRTRLIDKMWDAGFRMVQMGTDGLSNAAIRHNRKGYTLDRHVIPLNAYLRRKGFVVWHNLIAFPNYLTYEEAVECLMLYALLPLVFPPEFNIGIQASLGTHANNLDLLLNHHKYDWGELGARTDCALKVCGDYKVPVGFPHYALPVSQELEYAESEVARLAKLLGKKSIQQILTEDVSEATVVRIIQKWHDIDQAQYPQMYALSEAIIDLGCSDISFGETLFRIKSEMLSCEIYTFTDYLRHLRRETEEFAQVGIRFVPRFESVRSSFIQGQRDGIERQLAEIIEQRPDITDSYYFMIELLIQEGRYLEAMMYLHKLRLQKYFAPVYMKHMNDVLAHVRLNPARFDHPLLFEDLRFQSHALFQWMMLFAGIVEALGNRNVLHLSFRYEKTASLNTLYDILPTFSVEDSKNIFDDFGGDITQSLSDGKTAWLFGIPFRFNRGVLSVEIDDVRVDFDRRQPFEISSGSSSSPAKKAKEILIICSTNANRSQALRVALEQELAGKHLAKKFRVIARGTAELIAVMELSGIATPRNEPLVAALKEHGIKDVFADSIEVPRLVSLAELEQAALIIACDGTNVGGPRGELVQLLKREGLKPEGYWWRAIMAKKINVELPDAGVCSVTSTFNQEQLVKLIHQAKALSQAITSFLSSPRRAGFELAYGYGEHFFAALLEAIQAWHAAHLSSRSSTSSQRRPAGNGSASARTGRQVSSPLSRRVRGVFRFHEELAERQKHRDILKLYQQGGASSPIALPDILEGQRERIKGVFVDGNGIKNLIFSNAALERGIYQGIDSFIAAGWNYLLILEASPQGVLYKAYDESGELIFCRLNQRLRNLFAMDLLEGTEGWRVTDRRNFAQIYGPFLFTGLFGRNNLEAGLIIATDTSHKDIRVFDNAYAGRIDRRSFTTPFADFCFAQNRLAKIAFPNEYQYLKQQYYAGKSFGPVIGLHRHEGDAAGLSDLDEDILRESLVSGYQIIVTDSQSFVYELNQGRVQPADNVLLPHWLGGGIESLRLLPAVRASSSLSADSGAKEFCDKFFSGNAKLYAFAIGKGEFMQPIPCVPQCINSNILSLCLACSPVSSRLNATSYILYTKEEASSPLGPPRGEAAGARLSAKPREAEGLPHVLQQRPAINAEQAELLVDWLGDKKIKSVFDFGCGHGGWLKKLDRYPWVGPECKKIGYEKEQPTSYTNIPDVDAKKDWNDIIVLQKKDDPRYPKTGSIDLLHLGFIPGIAWYRERENLDALVCPGGWFLCSNITGNCPFKYYLKWFEEKGYLWFLYRHAAPADYPHSEWWDIDEMTKRVNCVRGYNYLAVAHKVNGKEWQGSKLMPYRNHPDVQKVRSWLFFDDNNTSSSALSAQTPRAPPALFCQRVAQPNGSSPNAPSDSSWRFFRSSHPKQEKKAALLLEAAFKAHLIAALYPPPFRRHKRDEIREFLREYMYLIAATQEKPSPSFEGFAQYLSGVLNQRKGQTAHNIDYRLKIETEIVEWLYDLIRDAGFSWSGEQGEGALTTEALEHDVVTKHLGWMSAIAAAELMQEAAGYFGLDKQFSDEHGNQVKVIIASVAADNTGLIFDHVVNMMVRNPQHPAVGQKNNEFLCIFDAALGRRNPNYKIVGVRVNGRFVYRSLDQLNERILTIRESEAQANIEGLTREQIKAYTCIERWIKEGQTGQPGTRNKAYLDQAYSLAPFEPRVLAYKGLSVLEESVSPAAAKLREAYEYARRAYEFMSQDLTDNDREFSEDNPTLNAMVPQILAVLLSILASRLERAYADSQFRDRQILAREFNEIFDKLKEEYQRSALGIDHRRVNQSVNHACVLSRAVGLEMPKEESPAVVAMEARGELDSFIDDCHGLLGLPARSKSPKEVKITSLEELYRKEHNLLRQEYALHKQLSELYRGFRHEQQSFTLSAADRDKLIRDKNLSNTPHYNRYVQNREKFRSSRDTLNRALNNLHRERRVLRSLIEVRARNPYSRLALVLLRAAGSVEVKLEILAHIEYALGAEKTGPDAAFSEIAQLCDEDGSKLPECAAQESILYMSFLCFRRIKAQDKVKAVREKLGYRAEKILKEAAKGSSPLGRIPSSIIEASAKMKFLTAPLAGSSSPAKSDFQERAARWLFGRETPYFIITVDTPFHFKGASVWQGYYEVAEKVSMIYPVMEVTINGSQYRIGEGYYLVVTLKNGKKIYWGGQHNLSGAFFFAHYKEKVQEIIRNKGMPWLHLDTHQDFGKYRGKPLAIKLALNWQEELNLALTGLHQGEYLGYLITTGAISRLFLAASLDELSPWPDTNECIPEEKLTLIDLAQRNITGAVGDLDTDLVVGIDSDTNFSAGMERFQIMRPYIISILSLCDVCFVINSSEISVDGLEPMFIDPELAVTCNAIVIADLVAQAASSAVAQPQQKRGQTLKLETNNTSSPADFQHLRADPYGVTGGVLETGRAGRNHHHSQSSSSITGAQEFSPRFIPQLKFNDLEGCRNGVIDNPSQAVKYLLKEYSTMGRLTEKGRQALLALERNEPQAKDLLPVALDSLRGKRMSKAVELLIFKTEGGKITPQLWEKDRAIFQGYDTTTHTRRTYLMYDCGRGCRFCDRKGLRKVFCLPYCDAIQRIAKLKREGSGFRHYHDRDDTDCLYYTDPVCQATLADLIFFHEHCHAYFQHRYKRLLKLRTAGFDPYEERAVYAWETLKRLHKKKLKRIKLDIGITFNFFSNTLIALLLRRRGARDNEIVPLFRPAEQPVVSGVLNRSGLNYAQALGAFTEIYYVLFTSLMKYKPKVMIRELEDVDASNPRFPEILKHLHKIQRWNLLPLFTSADSQHYCAGYNFSDFDNRINWKSEQDFIVSLTALEAKYSGHKTGHSSSPQSKSQSTEVYNPFKNLLPVRCRMLPTTVSSPADKAGSNSSPHLAKVRKLIETKKRKERSNAALRKQPSANSGGYINVSSLEPGMRITLGGKKYKVVYRLLPHPKETVKVVQEVVRRGKGKTFIMKQITGRKREIEICLRLKHPCHAKICEVFAEQGVYLVEDYSEQTFNGYIYKSAAENYEKGFPLRPWLAARIYELIQLGEALEETEKMKIVIIELCYGAHILYKDHLPRIVDYNQLRESEEETNAPALKYLVGKIEQTAESFYSGVPDLKNLTDLRARLKSISSVTEVKNILEQHLESIGGISQGASKLPAKERKANKKEQQKRGQTLKLETNNTSSPAPDLDNSDKLRQIRVSFDLIGDIQPADADLVYSIAQAVKRIVVSGSYEHEPTGSRDIAISAISVDQKPFLVSAAHNFVFKPADLLKAKVIITLSSGEVVFRLDSDIDFAWAGAKLDDMQPLALAADELQPGMKVIIAGLASGFPYRMRMISGQIKSISKEKGKFQIICPNECQGFNYFNGFSGGLVVCAERGSPLYGQAVGMLIAALAINFFGYQGNKIEALLPQTIRTILNKKVQRLLFEEDDAPGFSSAGQGASSPLAPEPQAKPKQPKVPLIYQRGGKIFKEVQRLVRKRPEGLKYVTVSEVAAKFKTIASRINISRSLCMLTKAHLLRSIRIGIQNLRVFALAEERSSFLRRNANWLAGYLFRLEENTKVARELFAEALKDNSRDQRCLWLRSRLRLALVLDNDYEDALALALKAATFLDYRGPQETQVYCAGRAFFEAEVPKEFLFKPPSIRQKAKAKATEGGLMPDEKLYLARIAEADLLTRLGEGFLCMQARFLRQDEEFIAACAEHDIDFVSPDIPTQRISHLTKIPPHEVEAFYAWHGACRLLSESLAQNQTAQREAWNSNLRLVVKFAKKYRRPPFTLMELISVGNEGLQRAVPRFEFQSGNRFSTYASWWIRQAITREIQDQERTVRIPPSQRDKDRKILKLCRRHHIEPTAGFISPVEIAEITGLAVSDIEDFLSRQDPNLSLDRVFDGREDDDRSATMGGIVEDSNQTYRLDILRNLAMEIIAEARERLEIMFSSHREAERDLEICDLYIFNRIRAAVGEEVEILTLEEVGSRFRVGRERIRQIQVPAVKLLRAIAKRKGFQLGRSIFDVEQSSSPTHNPAKFSQEHNYNHSCFVSGIGFLRPAEALVGRFPERSSVSSPSSNKIDAVALARRAVKAVGWNIGKTEAKRDKVAGKLANAAKCSSLCRHLYNADPERFFVDAAQRSTLARYWLVKWLGQWGSPYDENPELSWLFRTPLQLRKFEAVWPSLLAERVAQGNTESILLSLGVSTGEEAVSIAAIVSHLLAVEEPMVNLAGGDVTVRIVGIELQHDLVQTARDRLAGDFNWVSSLQKKRKKKKAEKWTKRSNLLVTKARRNQLPLALMGYLPSLAKIASLRKKSLAKAIEAAVSRFIAEHIARIRNLVTFEAASLIDPFTVALIKQADCIFLNNVLYLMGDATLKALAKALEEMRPGAYLFLMSTSLTSRLKRMKVDRALFETVRRGKSTIILRKKTPRVPIVPGTDRDSQDMTSSSAVMAVGLNRWGVGHGTPVTKINDLDNTAHSAPIFNLFFIPVTRRELVGQLGYLDRNIWLRQSLKAGFPRRGWWEPATLPQPLGYARDASQPTHKGRGLAIPLGQSHIYGIRDASQPASQAVVGPSVLAQATAHYYKSKVARF
jgi:RNA polymerase sigma factor (sigma-70 family)